MLLVDISGRVLLDSGESFQEHILRTLNSARHLNMENRQQDTIHMIKRDGNVFVSCPYRRIGAVVLVSVYIQDIYDDVNRFAFRISTISIMVAIVVVAVSILMGRHLSDPITVLTDAVDKIYKGSMESAVEIKEMTRLGYLPGI